MLVYGVNGLKKVLRIILTSTAICFSLTFALIIINAIMGIFVRLDYYFTIAWVLTACLSLGLILFDSKKIFSKKKRVVNRAKANKNIGQRKQQTSQSRRKIS